MERYPQDPERYRRGPSFSLPLVIAVILGTGIAWYVLYGSRAKNATDPLARLRLAEIWPKTNRRRSSCFASVRSPSSTSRRLPFAEVVLRST